MGIASRADGSHADGTGGGIGGHVRATRVVVVGGGVSGLVAALECAKVGLSVTLLDAASHLGGTVHTVDVAGCAVDVGADRFATRGGDVERIAGHLGIAGDIVDVAQDDAWVAGVAGGPVPLPRASLAGIPENPWDAEVRRIIGWSGAWRAFVDRVRPPLTIGQERSLGRLVRTRMGDRVLDRLVAPISIGVYGVHPDDVDVEEAAPGLSTALTRTGSLTGGVAQVRSALDAAPLKRFAGGMSQLVDALHERLVDLGADVRTGVSVERLDRSAAGGWIAVGVASGAARDDADDDTDLRDPSPEPLVFAADIVIVATPEATARRLLAPHASALAPPGDTIPDELEVVTLVVDTIAFAGSAMASASAVYPIVGASPAVSVTNARARAAAAESSSASHVVRVFFGSRLGRPATAGLDDDAAVAAAVAAASDLLATPLPDAVIRGARRDRFALPVAGSLSGRRDAAAATRAAISGAPGLSVVGAWLSGAGLARVIPDAEAEADRVRRAAVFGVGAPAEE